MNLKKTLKRFIKNEKGASAVEFALMSPFFLIIFAGLADTGLFVVKRMQMQTVVASTAEYVVNTFDDANVQTVATEIYPGDINDLTVTANFECECADGEIQACPIMCGTGDYQRRFIEISASGNFDPLFPYPVFGNNVTVRTSARLRVD